MNCLCRPSRIMSVRINLLDETDFIHEIKVSLSAFRCAPFSVNISHISSATSVATHCPPLSLSLLLSLSRSDLCPMTKSVAYFARACHLLTVMCSAREHPHQYLVRSLSRCLRLGKHAKCHHSHVACCLLPAACCRLPTP